MKAVCLAWEAELDGDQIYVRPNPWLEKSEDVSVINIGHLAAVDFKSAGRMRHGTLKLVCRDLHRPVSEYWSRQPYLFEFSRPDEKAWIALRDAIIDRMRALSATASPS